MAETHDVTDDLVSTTYQAQLPRTTYRSHVGDAHQQHDPVDPITPRCRMARSTDPPRCLDPGPGDPDPGPVQAAGIPSMSDASPPHRDATNRPAPEVEALARRALGIAMNALDDGGHETNLGAHEPTLVEQATVLLRSRVPDGPELALAVDVLGRAAASPRSAAVPP